MKNSLLSKLVPVLVIFGLLLTMVGAVDVNTVNAEDMDLTKEEGKEPSNDQNLNQSDSLQPLPEVRFQGYIYDKGIDGSMFHGFPLYASIHITQKNGSDFTIYSDPVTGYYSVLLLQHYVYTFEIRAMQPGYQPYIEEIETPNQLLYDRDFALHVDDVLCSAPGYEPVFSVLYTFEDSDEGFVAGGTTSFAWGEFTSGPNEGHSGTKGIATNPAGNYNPNENGYMLSPKIDLYDFGTNPAFIQWWEWRKTEEKNIWDNVSLEVTKDGGATWQKVWEPTSCGDGSGYSQQAVLLDPSYNVIDFQMRFYFKSDNVDQFEGWYIDDISIFNFYYHQKVFTYNINFEDDNGGFVPNGMTTSWEWGVPTGGPGSAHSGNNVWGTMYRGEFGPWERSTLTSPIIDNSFYAGLTPMITFFHWYQVAPGDRGTVQASNDGGLTWNDIWTPSRNYDHGWEEIWLPLDSSYSVSNFRIRFLFNFNVYGTEEGWYIDDVGVSFWSAPCRIVPGGVVAGYVYDYNDSTPIPIVGAEVSSETATTHSLSLDAYGYGGAPGYYWLFQPIKLAHEDIQFTASKYMYTDDVKVVSVEQDKTTRQDFSLGTGKLSINPSPLEVTVIKDASPVMESLTISNIGPADTAFQLFEKNGNSDPILPAQAASHENTEITRNGILASPPAYGIVDPANKLGYAPNINQPNNWIDIGRMNPRSFNIRSADFVEGDFSTLYLTTYANKLYAMDTTSAKSVFIADIVSPPDTNFRSFAGTLEGFLYGIAYDDGSKSYLVTVNVENGDVNNLGLIPDVVEGTELAYNSQDGTIYVLDGATSILYTINPETRATIKSAKLDLDADFISSMDFEENSGLLFGSVHILQGEIRQINVDTGATTIVGALPQGQDLVELVFLNGPTSNVPWLSEEPLNGMVAPDEEATVSVTIDPSGLEVGDYYATLRVKSLTIPGIDVPVVLHVTEYPKLYLPMIAK